MKPRKNRRNELDPTPSRNLKRPKFSPSKLRIVAGNLRNTKIEYNGDPATRPMKERTREAVFSLLGGYLHGTFAIDLFGGTGILAFESISRGAESAIILEMASTAVRSILGNLEKLGLANHVEVHNVDTLRWFRNLEHNMPNWPDLPWVVYCCPPYRMWEADCERLCEGISEMYRRCPVGSQFVCETEIPFDITKVMPQIDWDVRTYAPAFVALAEKRDDTEMTPVEPTTDSSSSALD